MTARYRGTCIGGVADGHYIERDDPEITVKKARRAREVIQLDGSTRHEEETIEESRYKFLLLLGNSNAEIGVWALEGWPLERIVERLVRCYNPRTGLIGTPAPNNIPIKRQ